jgi:hypothetical protein
MGGGASLRAWKWTAVWGGGGATAWLVTANRGESRFRGGSFPQFEPSI